LIKISISTHTQVHAQSDLLTNDVRASLANIFQGHRLSHHNDKAVFKNRKACHPIDLLCCRLSINPSIAIAQLFNRFSQFIQQTLNPQSHCEASK